jgi:acylphosphatase
MNTVRIIFSGRVQGVGFRWHVQRTAQDLGISGWVRNRSDGTVEAVCQGKGTDRLVQRCEEYTTIEKTTTENIDHDVMKEFLVKQ